MDRMIYLGMTGAKYNSQAQTTIANNLANLQTPGFKAQLELSKAVPVLSNVVNHTRTYNVSENQFWSQEMGKKILTHNKMNIALRDKGFIVVQDNNQVKLSRNGSLHIDKEGYLRNNENYKVMGENGAIQIKEQPITINTDGTIMSSNGMEDKIMLVNPKIETLKKEQNGLFISSMPISRDESLQVDVGYLEQSNVNVQQEMINMLQQARQYELNLKVIETANENAKIAQKILQ